jgi:hypothetical protein
MYTSEATGIAAGIAVGVPIGLMFDSIGRASASASPWRLPRA